MLTLLVCASTLMWGRPSPTLPVAPAIQADHRLRTILPSGAVISVEHVPQAQQLVIELFVSSGSTPDTPKTNGYRHLIEHFSARGRTRTLDQMLESQGAFLTAQTLRDATVYRISLRPHDLALGMTAVSSLMELGEITAADLAKECEIIRQEIALEDTPRKLSQAAWLAAYGDDGIDPLGDLDVMSAASPEAIKGLHKNMMAGNNLTLVISGDVDLDAGTQAATEVLNPIPVQEGPARQMKGYLGGGVSSVDADGTALASPVGSWSMPPTTARLAAALAIASEARNCFVTFTPSPTGSLIVVGKTGQASGLSKFVRTLKPAEEFGLGRTLAKAWVEQQRSIQNDSLLTGLLISEGAGQKPEAALANLEQMTVAEFTAAFESFRSKSVIEVVGK